MAVFDVQPVVNFGLVTAFQGYDASATSIQLQSGDGALLPDPATLGQYDLTWWDSTVYPNSAEDPKVEIVTVTADSSDVLTVTRGQQGTSASTKNTPGSTYSLALSLTKTQFEKLMKLSFNAGLATTGSANAYVITADTRVYGSYANCDGMEFRLKANFTNTDTCTANLNGLGAKSIKKNIDKPLAPGDIQNGQYITLVWDNTNDVFILNSPIAQAPVLLSRLTFANSSAAQDTGTIASASNYKFFEIRMSGYRNTASGSGQMRVTVNAIGGTAYEHTLQSGNTTYSAPITGAAYWTMYSGVLDDKSLLYSWLVSNVKAPTGKVMFAANAQYFHSNVSANGQVALGSDTEISKFTFTPMDGASADPITMTIEVYGYL